MKLFVVLRVGNHDTVVELAPGADLLDDVGDGALLGSRLVVVVLVTATTINRNLLFLFRCIATFHGAAVIHSFASSTGDAALFGLVEVVVFGLLSVAAVVVAGFVVIIVVGAIIGLVLFFIFGVGSIG